MSSFQRLWENIQQAKSDKTPHDDRAMSAIRTGIGLNEEFWDNFLQIINNSEGLSELLDVPITKIATWHDRVKHNLDQVKKADQTPDPSDNGKLMKTGMPDDVDTQPVMTKQPDENIN